MPRNSPRVSVVIPTYNRAPLLKESLASLARQSLPVDEFEVLVVDDGSPDDTADVCATAAATLPLRHIRLEHAGIAAAKNIGLFSAAGEVVFFFDDDDVAHADLLRQHLAAHRRWPEESAAVLNFTTWAPWLHVSEVMHYVTDVGQFLFSYRGIEEGRPLDFTRFWGGRSSCKRSFLARHGAFRQDFEFGCEDIELGYRLSQFGLKVFFDRRAVSFMNRGITFAEFCRRCERQGRAQFTFSQLHADQVIQDYCQIPDANARFQTSRPRLADAVARVEQLERQMSLPETAGVQTMQQELWDLYRFAFTTFKLKGIVEAAAEQQSGAIALAAADRALA